MGAPLADGDVDVDGFVVDVVVSSEPDGAVVVIVVVDGGGAASGLCGSEPPLPPDMTITPASSAASANMATVPANSAFCVRLNRDLVTGAAGSGDGAWGT